MESLANVRGLRRYTNCDTINGKAYFGISFLLKAMYKPKIRLMRVFFFE